ncbi:hypothetical protein GUJ93_ZPchr0013g37508 [Zizania palustris]|uniref:Uncharacterized protein n=1 Tax=Zizania palustris TaxID=103762 RepID=A0A8J6C014_ZIZPA|nr:hypothetical protein GUJ93_ZPchr0013g37508 [Zizania palustris]
MLLISSENPHKMVAKRVLGMEAVVVTYLNLRNTSHDPHTKPMQPLGALMMRELFRALQQHGAPTEQTGPLDLPTAPHADQSDSQSAVHGQM